MVAKKLGPNTNFEIEILKFSALVKTERDVKLIAVPAHQPIRCACIKKAASQTDSKGPNIDKIGADVIIGCTPIKLKHQTIKGNKMIIIQNGKYSPILLFTKFWISTELVNIDPKNIDTEISNISSPEFCIKFFKFLKMKFDVSGRLNI